MSEAELTPEASSEETILYGHINAWAEALKIKPSILYARLRNAPYIQGVTNKGDVARAFVEEDVRRLCMDLLLPKEDPQLWKQQLLQRLKENKISDRVELRLCGVSRFAALSFQGIGKGIAFCGAVTGRALTQLRVENLEELADVLHLPEMSEETRIRFVAMLEEKAGIIDVATMRNIGTNKFRRVQFDGYHGAALFRVLTGQASKLSRRDGLEIAAILHLPTAHENTKARCKELLRINGVTDWVTARRKGVNKFREFDFKEFGKAKKMYFNLTGKIPKNLTAESMEEFFRIIDLPKISESTKCDIRGKMEALGIRTKGELLHFGVTRFRSAQIEDWGGTFELFSLLTGKTSRLGMLEMEEMADMLCMPSNVGESVANLPVANDDGVVIINGIELRTRKGWRKILNAEHKIITESLRTTEGIRGKTRNGLVAVFYPKPVLRESRREEKPALTRTKQVTDWALYPEPLADDSLSFDYHDQKYGLKLYWAKRLGVTPTTITNRLGGLNGNGISGRLKNGKLLERRFFSEFTIRSVAEDLFPAGESSGG
ncbi:MAG TPA: hypothetical protein DEB30_05400 [Candidatus Peribacter riflensis]|uniref:Uncharacterized protein n=1 Tax=Candidatus Peribacter riflensis TaxID=1735162 RepID=A0A0S1SK65_9BACT|nr:MAG: hypothetical protein PeribacterA2_0115 [Candidatus Peribacter riflensis]OGJ76693.1 MAG: hypothetical protein A2398_03620 [Candidatus Peribacteria bacterium RIFOXYB1_FULL_57_12]OGJ78776.1 MAG: hypothetical protein A2412_02340 [Candidatus Peribacteria bacterium RIFOXYC1_FULL_58_8]ALM10613.1 MAG: hypothetical protein PeribacterB2_0115 [Candidatus Peribacter riflensis]ALM11715.1 MAG: hypothetical protein PeribacterC2_0114 [Candidatus Peribacter riflensis]